jgi:hypothetical protein
MRTPRVTAEELAARLRAVLARGAFFPDARELALLMLRRLERPTRPSVEQAPTGRPDRR